jgi:hypothetical protein
LATMRLASVSLAAWYWRSSSACLPAISGNQ